MGWVRDGVNGWEQGWGGLGTGYMVGTRVGWVRDGV